MLASLALALVFAPAASAQRSAVRATSYGGAPSALRSTAYESQRDLRSPRYGSRGAIRSTSYGRRAHYVQARAWVPGHYATERRDVWVPARTESVWVEPVFDVRCDSRGVSVRILLREGHYRDVYHPGHYASRSVQVWVPGHWSESGCRT